MDEINDVVSETKITKYYLSLIQNYGQLLKDEQLSLFKSSYNGGMVTDLQLDYVKIQIPQETKNEIYNRMELTFREFANEIFWEIIVVFAVYLVFLFWVDHLCNKSLEREIAMYGWNSNQGILKNVVRNALAFGCGYLERRAIKAKYKKIKTWCNVALTILTLVVSYFWIMRPQMLSEEKIQEDLIAAYDESVANVDVPVLDYFNLIVLNQ